MKPAAVVDSALEATVALSFSRIGFAVRAPLFHWEPPSAAPERVFIVTGATSGLGEQCALDLARTGATVWLLGRSATRLSESIARIAATVPGARLRPITADLSSMREVATVVDQFRGDRLDGIIHNAGVLPASYALTSDGLETAVQVHLVAPTRLTTDLLPLLRATPGSRVITVSSGGMYTQAVHVSDLEPDPKSYNGTRQYARTKRAQVVVSERWSRLEPDVAFHAMHPGWALTPGLTESLPAFTRSLRPLLRDAAEGADTAIWLATSYEALPSGRFWHDRRPRSTARLPRTRTSPADEVAIWEWIAERSGAKIA